MTAEIIQFVPRSSRKPTEQEMGWFYESILDMPAGSYRGTHLNVPCFEVPSLPSPDKDSA